MSSQKDIQKKSDQELQDHIAEKREEVRKFRFGTAGAGTRDVRAVRTAKKEIARSLTELNARLTASNAKAKAHTESNQQAK